ncbi:MAG: GAF domain-containing protein [Stenomitos rutilans HA7619-LM2]|nr:GAF domain-containing protein [Stenomitos rutilans HA7619-LM2]
MRMDSSTLHADFAAALSGVCQVIDWDYGEVWLPNLEINLLELSPVWHGHPNRSSDRLEDLRKFRACSEKFALSIDEGLPGRIWRSRQPEWINDVSMQSESYFLRNQIAKAFSIKAGFGFPAFCEQEIIGIFVFFTDCACEKNTDLIERAIAAATLSIS